MKDYVRLKEQLLFYECLPDTEVAAQCLTAIRRWVERGADPDGWKEDWGLDPAAASLRAAKKRDNGSAGKQGGGKEPKIPAEDPVPSIEQLQGTVPHSEYAPGETSAGLPSKKVLAVAARPQGPPVQAAKGKMPVSNNTAVKGQITGHGIQACVAKWLQQGGGERCLTRDRPSGHVTHNALTTRMHPPPPQRQVDVITECVKMC